MAVTSEPMTVRAGCSSRMHTSRMSTSSWCGLWGSFSASRELPRRTGPRPHPDRQPATPPAAGTASRWGEEVPVRRPGPGPAGVGAAAGCRGPHAPAAGRRPGHRTGARRQTDQVRQHRVARAGRRQRQHPDGVDRGRPVQRGAPARRHRGHRPVHRQGPVRVLERHGAAGGVFR